MSRYDWPGRRRGRESEDDPAARERFNRLLRRNELGDVALPRSALATRAPPAGRTHLWQPLGPQTVVGGQAEGGPRITGRINSLAVDATGQRIYAASGHGGVWYSSDGGASWRALGGFASTATAGIDRPAQRHACGAVWVDFGATEADDVVFVGTGDPAHAPDAAPGISLGGVGILVATGPAASGSFDPWTREAPNLIGDGCYRIARQPSGIGVCVATRSGLYERPASPATDVAWAKPAGTPFDTLSDRCTDALWTAGDATRPERLWVWVSTGASAGLWVRDAGQVNFTQVPTVATVALRASLAASTPPDQMWVFNDQGAGNLPVLNRIASASAAAPVATQVSGVPDMLGPQGFYDITIAIDPARPNRVTLGGCFMATTTPDGTVVRGNGAITVADVVAGATAGSLTYGSAAAPFTMIGIGVHADVHDLRFSNNGATLWTGCDGGVFRSDRPASPVGFYARNHGMTIVDANFLGNHPTSEGFVSAGLQDNAVVTRLSNGVWRLVGLGDGGGIVFDPLRRSRFMRQHFRGFWSSSDGTLNGTEMLTRAGAFATNEHNASAFYSMPAGIDHRRGAVAPAAPDIGQIIAGTNRLWYTEDFGATWVTLPTGTDPLPANLAQDALASAITVCRWQSADVAWVLTTSQLLRYARTPGSDAGGGPGTWAMASVVAMNVGEKDDGSFTFGPMRSAAAWTEIAVNLEPPAAAGGPPTVRGATGALYLGTSGNASNPDVDTLWWFDGDTVWHPTGLRASADGVPAPVTALVCDPALPDEVYVGTTVGVWKGTRTLGAGLPTWQWSSRLNGLPEAAVEDLAILHDGDLRVLRAAIAARGVWELRLDQPDVPDLTYLRAHQDDLRHRAAVAAPLPALLQRDGVTPRSWHGSPDVRPRVAPEVPAAPTGARWRRGGANVDVEKLRRFQAALRSSTGDVRVRATGQWDVYFNEVLREHGAPTLPTAPNVVALNTAFWNSTVAAPHGSAEAWSTVRPTEADLYDFTPALAEGELGKASCTLPRARCKVEVVAHHRGLNARDGTGVRVLLLRFDAPTRVAGTAWNDVRNWSAGDVPWTAAANQLLNSDAGTTALPLGAGWSQVGARATLDGQVLDAFNSGVASFDLDMRSARRQRVVLLVALLRAGADVGFAPAPLEVLVRNSANVAVRSVLVR
jgi:hypothetical protein